MLVNIKDLINEILTHQVDGEIELNIINGEIIIEPPRKIMKKYSQELISDISGALESYREKYSTSKPEDESEYRLLSEDGLEWLMSTAKISTHVARRLTKLAFDKETIEFIMKKVPKERKGFSPTSMLGKDVFKM